MNSFRVLLLVNHFVGKEIYGFRIENRNQMFFSQLVTISKADCDDITQLTENCFDSDFDSENSGVFLLCTEEIRFPISNNFVHKRKPQKGTRTILLPATHKTMSTEMDFFAFRCGRQVFSGDRVCILRLSCSTKCLWVKKEEWS
jgi:hypothetical protein